MGPEFLWLLGRFSRPPRPRNDNLYAAKFKDILYQGLDEHVSFMSKAVGDYKSPQQPTVFIHPKEYVNGFLESSSVSVDHLALMAHVRYPDWHKALSLFPACGATRLQNMAPVLEMLQAGVKVEKECGVLALLTEDSPYVLPTVGNMETGDPHSVLDMLRNIPEDLLLGPENMTDLDDLIEKLTAGFNTQGSDMGAEVPQELTGQLESVEAECEKLSLLNVSHEPTEDFNAMLLGLTTVMPRTVTSSCGSAENDTSADETDPGVMTSMLGFLNVESHLLSVGSGEGSSSGRRPRTRKAKRPKIKYGGIIKASVLQDIKELPTPLTSQSLSPVVRLQGLDSHGEQTSYGFERLEAALGSEPEKKLKMQASTQTENWDSLFADAQVPGPSRVSIVRNTKKRAVFMPVDTTSSEVFLVREEIKSACTTARAERIGEAVVPKVRFQHCEDSDETQIKEMEDWQDLTDSPPVTARCRRNKSAKMCVP